MLLTQPIKTKENNEMKKYVTPEMEITEFDTEDVITTSGDGSDDDPVTPEIPF